MSGGLNSNTSVEMAGKAGREQVKEGGLAPLARKILDGVFRTKEHEEFMNSILEQSNRIFAGTGTKDDLDKTITAIEEHKKSISKIYPADVQAITYNYFAQLEKRLKESSETKAA